MAASNSATLRQVNFLRQFRDEDTKKLRDLTAQQFMEVWRHYDEDDNGYIEGHELDNFLQEFVLSVTNAEVGSEALSDASLQDLKEAMMEAFDENEDKRIEIGELAQILPTEENFLLLFRRDNPLDSRVEFMKIWRKFDHDCSGYIDADELKSFLSHLLKEAKPDTIIADDKLIEYTDTMLQLFDKNKDGKLQLSEMAKLLPVKENFLSRPIFKNATKISKYDIERVFQLYDRDKNGYIDDTELLGFLIDLISLVHDDYDEQDLMAVKENIFKHSGVCRNGRINKSELMIIISHTTNGQ